MKNTYHAIIAGELSLTAKQVENTLKLLAEGGTVPFISRYRKEMTGNLDEVQISCIQDLQHKLEEVDQRREFISKTISEQGKMTEELQQKIDQANSLTELEDIYLPYKVKRKTRAAAAIEKGLEPLANIIREGKSSDPAAEAAGFVNEKVASAEDALKGARDIIAEGINETAEIREQLRHLFAKSASLSAKIIEGKEEAGHKYRDYFDFKEPVANMPSHRVLAIFRAEKEGVLAVNISPAEEEALAIIEKHIIDGQPPLCVEQLQLTAKDAYKRLLRPSLENESRTNAKTAADEEAIGVFAENLRQLLLAAPLGPKPVIAIDPGYRTGCKVVALDEQGNLQENHVIFPLEKNEKSIAAGELLKHLVKKYNAVAVTIGNGTAGRETEAFVKQLDFDKNVIVLLISENGASVYSASEAAREEFPDYDVTVRGAVSIGRRLMDPLAELVKIDPKSIGVGQYQHDVNQSLLKQSLDRVVESCVNNVGVDLNTASKHLLAYVAGLGPSLAENIINYRRDNGAFQSREQLKKVSRLGDKAFEQCAGFLRIPGADNPLDNSAVHPERYDLVKNMAGNQACTVEELIRTPEKRKTIKAKDYISEEVGLLTVEDILKELEKPGRDPRDEFSLFEYAEGISKIEDLKPGMELPGVVTNITNFGAFVDIGVKQDGLVHISQLTNRFITNPAEVVKLQQKVTVTVIEVDIPRKRISLSMRKQEAAANNNTGKKAKAGKERPKKDFNSALKNLQQKYGRK